MFRYFFVCVRIETINLYLISHSYLTHHLQKKENHRTSFFIIPSREWKKRNKIYEKDEYGIFKDLHESSSDVSKYYRLSLLGMPHFGYLCKLSKSLWPPLLPIRFFIEILTKFIFYWGRSSHVYIKLPKTIPFLVLRLTERKI